MSDTADPPLGELIHRRTDPEGEIQVYAQGRQRTLTFGNTVEQTRVDLDHPARLVHAYTQAMLLGVLLVPAPVSALLLGLGGGALAQALLAWDPALSVTAVEARAIVVQAAREYLALPHTGRLRIDIGDAMAFLDRPGPGWDLAFLDLYGAQGAHSDQGAVGFLTACRARLNARGVLVSNHWMADFAASRREQSALEIVFPGQVLYLHIPGGSAIGFAFAQALPRLRRSPFLAGAEALGLRLDLPLHRLARAFWGQNALALKTARLCPSA